MIVIIFDFFKYTLLAPLAFLWERLLSLRRAFYANGIFSQSFFKVPVISIGNITFGGTGKTPFAIWLADYFADKNLKTLILTRGYKGAFEHGVGIINGGDTFRFNPITYGDEAILIARHLKNGAVVVGKKRSENLETYFDELLPDTVLLDDGFQHQQINRNLDIVLFDALLPLSRYRVAPFGYLREGLTSLYSADVIVISRCDQVSSIKLSSLKELIGRYTRDNIPVVEITYRSNGIFDSYHKKVMDANDLNKQKVICVVAIASPNSFFSMVEFYGAEIVDRIIFPDHYYYTAEDVEMLAKRAEELDAVVITSEKDIVKIRRISMDLGMLYVSVEIVFLNGFEQLEKHLSFVGSDL